MRSCRGQGTGATETQPLLCLPLGAMDAPIAHTVTVRGRRQHDHVVCDTYQSESTIPDIFPAPDGSLLSASSVLLASQAMRSMVIWKVLPADAIASRPDSISPMTTMPGRGMVRRPSSA